MQELNIISGGTSIARASGLQNAWLQPGIQKMQISPMKTKNKNNKHRKEAHGGVAMKFTFKSAIALILLAIFVAVMGVSPVQAQDVATGSATATILAVLTVSNTAALAFGNIFQGVAVSVGNQSAGAGVFTIVGAAGSGITLYLSLPDYLATSSGDDRMVISFSSSDASVDTTTNTTPTTFGAGYPNVNPHAFGTTALNTVQAAVFLGGTATPTVDQAAGAYTADIILTVAYDGT